MLLLERIDWSCCVKRVPLLLHEIDSFAEEELTMGCKEEMVVECVI